MCVGMENNVRVFEQEESSVLRIKEKNWTIGAMCGSFYNGLTALTCLVQVRVKAEPTTTEDWQVHWRVDIKINRPTETLGAAVHYLQCVNTAAVTALCIEWTKNKTLQSYSICLEELHVCFPMYNSWTIFDSYNIFHISNGSPMAPITYRTPITSSYCLQDNSITVQTENHNF